MDNPRDVAARHGERLPLPDEEQSALEAAAEHLAAFRCPKCGREWITGRTTTMLWHSCPVDLDLARANQTRRQRVHQKRTYTFTLDREEETAAWAEDRFGPIGDALTDSIESQDPDALLRRHP